MKNKQIILILILIVSFMFMPSKVEAKQVCDLKISGIEADKAMLSWNCTDGDYVSNLNGYWLYGSDKDCKLGTQIGNFNNFPNEKVGTQQITGLSANTHYIVRAKIKDKDYLDICVRTGTKGVVKPDYSTKKYNKYKGTYGDCTYEIDNLEADAVDVIAECDFWSKDVLTYIGIYACENGKTYETCSRSTVVETPTWEYNPLGVKSHKERVHKLQPNSSYIIQYNFNFDQSGNFFIKINTPNLISDGEVLNPGVISQGGSTYDDSLTAADAADKKADKHWSYDKIDGTLDSNLGDAKTTFCQPKLRGLIRKYWRYLTIGAPILLILLMSFDFTKAVIANDVDAMKKSSSYSIKRAVATALLLFLPLILKLIFGLFGLGDDYICF